jgi:hypothetical protein
MLRYTYTACLVSVTFYTFISHYTKWTYNVCGLPAVLNDLNVFQFSVHQTIIRVKQNAFAVNWHIYYYYYYY